MQKSKVVCSEVALALLLVLVNAWTVVRLIGLPYGPFQWAVFAQTYLGESDFPGGCSDGVDNNGDGLVDCVDPDCRADPGCTARAPILGAPGVALAIFVLLVVSYFGLWRRPARGSGTES